MEHYTVGGYPCVQSTLPAMRQEVIQSKPLVVTVPKTVSFNYYTFHHKAMCTVKYSHNIQPLDKLCNLT